MGVRGGCWRTRMRHRPSVGRTPLNRKARFARPMALMIAAIVLSTLLGCKSQVSGDVVATVDGRKIFRSDIDKYYDNQVASAQQPPPAHPALILRLTILRPSLDHQTS